MRAVQALLLSAVAAVYCEYSHIISRSALSHDEMMHLRRFHASLAAAPLHRAWRAVAGQDLPVDALWLQYDEMWDFWRRSSLPARARRILGEDVALLTDFFITIRGWHAPYVIGQWHTDSTSFDVVDGASLTAWIPLDDIDALTAGGSICLWNGSSPAALPPACRGGHFLASACQASLSRHQHVPSFKSGDVLFFGPHTIHRSQPLHPGGARRARTALVARFVSTRARYRAPGAGAVAGPVQRKNACRHGLQPGDVLADSACFPRLAPPHAPHAYRRRTRRVRAPALRWAWLNLRRALERLSTILRLKYEIYLNNKT